MSHVIIAGGRHFTNMTVLENAVHNSGFDITVVLSGACLVNSKFWRKLASGADGLGELWALHHGIPVHRYYADKYGPWPSCGPIRNEAMGKHASAVILLPGGRGTQSMFEIATGLGLGIYDAREPKAERK